MLIYIIALIIITIVFTFNFRTLTNLKFSVIFTALCILLLCILQDLGHVREPFDGNSNATQSVGYPLFKLLQLPDEIKSIIVPKLDFIINAFSSIEEEGIDDSEETIIVSELDFIDEVDVDADPDNANVSENTLDENKVTQLLKEYASIDAALNSLKEVYPDKYERLLLSI